MTPELKRLLKEEMAKNQSKIVEAVQALSSVPGDIDIKIRKQGNSRVKVEIVHKLDVAWDLKDESMDEDEIVLVPVPKSFLGEFMAGLLEFEFDEEPSIDLEFPPNHNLN